MKQLTKGNECFNLLSGWITNYAIEIGFVNLDDKIMDNLAGTADEFTKWLDDKTPSVWGPTMTEKALEDWLNDQCT